MDRADGDGPSPGPKGKRASTSRPSTHRAPSDEAGAAPSGTAAPSRRGSKESGVCPGPEAGGSLTRSAPPLSRSCMARRVFWTSRGRPRHGCRSEPAARPHKADAGSRARRPHVSLDAGRRPAVWSAMARGTSASLQHIAVAERGAAAEHRVLAGARVRRSSDAAG
jgi:hypothetical protein